MADYTSISGKPYSSGQIEKVGGNYYVKGTSINVSPSSVTTGAATTKTTTKTNTGTTSRTSGTRQTPTADYTGNLQWFGSPGAYAAEISRKEAAGTSLSDPTAAQAFRTAYPQYFPTQPPPPMPLPIMPPPQMPAPPQEYPTPPSLDYLTSRQEYPTPPSFDYSTPPSFDYPTPPSFDYSTPDVPKISREDALSRAKAQYEPQYKSAVLSRDKMASDQRERLAQMLGARGYANPRGGMRQTGEGNITQEQAMALENLRNQYDSIINQYASDIYTGESSEASQRLDAMLADRDARNQTALQKYTADLEAASQRDASEDNQYTSYLDYFIKLLTDEY